MEKLETYLIQADNPVGKKQRRPIFRRKRATEVLTREQVAAIKKGRKVLRAEMKAQGIKKKSDFELTAANMGLYFDKHRGLLWLQWLFHGRGLWALLGALLLLMLTLFGYSIVTQLQGHFTINMSDGMFKEGFVLSETKGFENPTTHLFAVPAEGVPCISISHLPEYLDTIDGQHNETYFAYTFYCRNEGESTVGYEWSIGLNSESKDLSTACWVMVFEDSEMLFYAKPNGETGQPEALPPKQDNTRGFIMRPLEQFNKSPETQYEIIKKGVGYDYNRVIPLPFLSDIEVARGTQEEVKPGDVHKYTVVIWLEGDDPDCTDELIGGHVGMDFQFRLVSEEDGASDSGGDFFAHWDAFWSNLKFWE